jgi:two-component system, NtrC family, C4-dicarboxylate transport sensor histidine kinase DctB
MRKIYRINLLFILTYIAITALGAHLVWRHSYSSLLDEHQAQLSRFSSHIESRLDKYAHIPRLLSKDKELVNALLNASNSAQIEITNRYLEQVNDSIQAADTYLIDDTGKTIASSNWSLKRSFIGRNFSWRPYFQSSIAGKESQYFALGSTSGQRGYYYSYPVVYAASIVGVVVVKMDLSSIEEHWQSNNSYFVATDNHSVVFMSSNPGWLFNSISELSDANRQTIQASKQYLNRSIQPIGLVGKMDVAIAEWKDPQQGWMKGDFIVTSRPLENINLTIRILTPKISIFWDSFGFVILSSMTFAIIYLALLLNYHRKVKQHQIEQLESEAKQKLEFLVMERTAKLHAEIHERAKTEQQLRQTQNELIQAAKLAVLGQMSASISHELNNPLAAIRSFADNGRRFLAKNKLERADENLQRISGLTERMAKIGTQLKSFARKSTTEEQATVQLTPIIYSTKELMQAQFKSQYIEFTFTLPETAIWLKVNVIQLEQVLINLLTNAMQAVEQLSTKQVTLSASSHAQTVTIYVDDNGAGLQQEQMVHLFEPFFTTKKNGLGLGLSISQQILHSMNGSLSAALSPLGGARFIITLPMAEPDSALPIKGLLNV